MFQFVQCLSDIGGILSILIGMSMISLMELGDLIVRLLLCLVPKPKPSQITSSLQPLVSLPGTSNDDGNAWTRRNEDGKSNDGARRNEDGKSNGGPRRNEDGKSNDAAHAAGVPQHGNGCCVAWPDEIIELV